MPVEIKNSLIKLHLQGTLEQPASKQQCCSKERQTRLVAAVIQQSSVVPGAQGGELQW